MNKRLASANAEISALEAVVRGVGKQSTSPGSLDKSMDVPQEVQRLNSVIFQKNSEIEQLKSKLAGASLKDSSVEGYNKINTQSKEYLDLNLRFAELQSENAKLRLSTKELENLKYEYQQTNSELERLRGVIAEKTKENEKLQTRISHSGHPSDYQTQELEIKLQQIVNENLRLNDLLADCHAEIDQLKAQSRGGSGGGYEKSVLEGKLDALGKENIYLNERIAQLSRELEARGSYSNADENMSRINYLTEENKRLTSLLNDSLRENEALKLSHPNTEDLYSKISLLATENDRLNQLLWEKTGGYETSTPNGQSHALKNSSTERDLKRLSDDRDWLREKVFDLQQELERQKAKSGNAELLIKKIEELEERVNPLYSQHAHNLFKGSLDRYRK